MTSTQHLLKWFVTLFYNKFEVTLFMFKVFLKVFQINYSLQHLWVYRLSTQRSRQWCLPMVIHQRVYTSVYFTRASLYLSSKPSQCITRSAHPQMLSGLSYPLCMVTTFIWASTHRLGWTRHSWGPPHSLADSLSSGLLGRVHDLSRDYLATSRQHGQTTSSISNLLYRQDHSPSPHCTVDWTQKSEN